MPNDSSHYTQVPDFPVPNYLAPLPHDPLADALRALEPKSEPQPKPEPVKEPQPTAADAARNKLAEEALLANPAEMRKQFPTLLKDMNIDAGRSLNMAEIDQGLKNRSLSQADQNFLTVLKQGYAQLSRSSSFDQLEQMNTVSDPEGISADCLAVIDKAVNRDINEDPLFSLSVKADPLGAAVLFGGASTFYSFRETHDMRTSLLVGGVGAAAGLIFGEGLAIVGKFEGLYDNIYNKVEWDYKSFVSEFNSRPPDPM